VPTRPTQLRQRPREPRRRDAIGDNADPDDDGDGASDVTERLLGTDPLDPDTDGDGYLDGAELAAGSDPLDPASTPQGPPLPPAVPALAGVQQLLLALLLAAPAWVRLRALRRLT
jgi:hypothetical protein